MLIGLIFRGVAFEFRFKAKAGKRRMWDKAFIGGSVVATFFQGVTLGAFIDGVAVLDGNYAGGALDWLTPFSLFTGFGAGGRLRAARRTWLIMKTEGALQAAHARAGAQSGLGAAGGASQSSASGRRWRTPAIAARWFSLPNLFWFSPVPLLVGWSHGQPDRARSSAARDAAPFVLTLALIFLGYSGLGISLWPNIIPPDLDLGRGRAAAEPGLRAGRRAADHPVHPDVHRLELLGVPRQGARG